MSWCKCQRLFNISKNSIRLSLPSLALNSLDTRLYSSLRNRTCRNQTITCITSRPISVFVSRCQSGADEREKGGHDESEERNRAKNEKKPKSSALVTKDFFDSLGNKSKDTFLTAIEVFITRDIHARGHVEFIYSAMKHMKEFGVHRDLDAYKKLIDIFPKGKFVASNMFQVEFMHFPKQQQCGIDLLEQMETMGVIPDSEVEMMMIVVFGNHAFPLRKLRRMLYWMPKFRNLSPWPVPDPVPEAGFEIAKLAIERITSVDLQTKISVFYPLEGLEDSIDPTWIISGQSPSQQRLIQEHPLNKPIYVEGAFRIWLRRACINYFILRAEPKPVPIKTTNEDDVGILSHIFKEDYVEKEVAKIPNVHEQEDGVILAACATGTSSHDSLLSWIRFLERTNPRLGKDIPVVFTLKSPLGPTDDLSPVTLSDDIPPTDGFLDSGRDSQLDKSIMRIGENSSDSPDKRNPLSLDPRNPELSQVGIDETSDTRFVNWPHHYNQNRKRRMSEESFEKDGHRTHLND